MSRLIEFQMADASHIGAHNPQVQMVAMRWAVWWVCTGTLVTMVVGGAGAGAATGVVTAHWWPVQ